MKINLLTLFLVLAVLSAHCQDRIIKNDKTEIKSKIEEILHKKASRRHKKHAYIELCV